MLLKAKKIMKKIGLRKRGIAMTAEQFDCEKNYRLSISIAKSMLSKGLIDKKDYRRIDSMLITKYKPIIGSF